MRASVKEPKDYRQSNRYLKHSRMRNYVEESEDRDKNIPISVYKSGTDTHCPSQVTSTKNYISYMSCN